MQTLNPKVNELLRNLQHLILRRNHFLALGRRCYLLRLRIWWNMLRLSWLEG